MKAPFAACALVAVSALSLAPDYSASAGQRYSTTAFIPCDVSLTLTLKPGLEYPACTVLEHPAPDIPPDPVVIQVPLYPGATPTTRAFPASFDYPATPYLKTATAEFLLPAGSTTVDPWYREHFAACGYGRGGTIESSTGSTGIVFSSTTDPNLVVEVSYQDVPDGTPLLYVAEDVTLPPRPPDSYLPGNIVRLTMDYVGDNERHWHLLVRNRAMIHSLVAAINAVSEIDGGVHSCAPVIGEATMTFARRGGTSVQVKAQCHQVVVGTTRPLFDDNLRVWKLIHRLVKRCPTSRGCRRSRPYVSRDADGSGAQEGRSFQSQALIGIWSLRRR